MSEADHYWINPDDHPELYALKAKDNSGIIHEFIRYNPHDSALMNDIHSYLNIAQLLKPDAEVSEPGIRGEITQLHDLLLNAMRKDPINKTRYRSGPQHRFEEAFETEFQYDPVTLLTFKYAKLHRSHTTHIEIEKTATWKRDGFFAGRPDEDFFIHNSGMYTHSKFLRMSPTDGLRERKLAFIGPSMKSIPDTSIESFRYVRDLVMPYLAQHLGSNTTQSET